MIVLFVLDSVPFKALSKHQLQLFKAACKVGKLQRMRKKGNRGYIEYREPLKFEDSELMIMNIETVFQVYSTLKDELISS